MTKKVDQLAQFVNLKGGLGKKEGVVFLRGGWYPIAHYEINQYLIMYIFLFFAYIKVIFWIEYIENSIFHIL